MIAAGSRSGPQVRCEACCSAWSWPLPGPGTEPPPVLPCPHCGCLVTAPPIVDIPQETHQEQA